MPGPDVPGRRDVCLWTSGRRSLLAALRAGARGYAVKGADHGEIVAAIRAVARGEVLLGRAVSNRF